MKIPDQIVRVNWPLGGEDRVTHLHRPWSISVSGVQSLLSSFFPNKQDENDANGGYFVNKLVFLDNRPPPAVANEAANLVSCGASGWV